MSTFTPDIPPIPRPSEVELLGRFVPSALRRMPPVAKIWRLPRLVLLSLFSAGYFPCRALQVRVRQTLMMHAQQCELSSQLLDKYLPADDAAIVREAAGGVRVSFALLNFSALLMLASLAMLVYWLSERGFDRDGFAQWWLHGPARHDALAIWATALLSLAFLGVIAQINEQIVALQKFALAFNAAAGEDLPPIEPPPLVFGLKIPHLVLGIVGACFGLYWALPLMLAWGAFTAFVRRSAYEFRVQLAERLSAYSHVEPVIPLSDLCPNPKCRHSLPIGAEFCPRCGTEIDAA